MNFSVDRRDVLKILTGSVLAGPPLLTAAEAGKPLYFSKEEFDLLDRLTEIIIPRDLHSPGAHDAGVAVFIDRRVAEAFLSEEKDAWKNGLAEIERLSMKEAKRPFLKAGKERQIDLLKKLAHGEDNPKSDGEKFFKRLKGATVFAYYSSEIGIHAEMEYKGNVILEQFVGYDAI